MKWKLGFTLVELLVVIAIITILASIVVPNVTEWIDKARVAKAVSEIKSADLALTKLLSDAEVSNFTQLLEANTILNRCSGSLQAAQDFYTGMFYTLLKQGKDADYIYAPLKPEIRRKLGSSYMPLDTDPWGNLYQFFAGPLRPELIPVPPAVVPTGLIALNAATNVYYPMPFRIYSANEKVPGGPKTDIWSNQLTTGEWRGYPATGKMPVFIYSFGKDMVNGQAMFATGPYGSVAGGMAAYSPLVLGPENAFGGDDINNWDTGQSWNMVE
jgi:prepilin-type N-terminal cleavage/methylation domain-containing protein